MKRVLSCFLATLCAALVLSPCAAAQTQELRFPADGKLKIMVVADAQDTQYTSPVLGECLDAVLTAEQPDLVVLLGDQIEGQHPFIHLSNNEANVKQTIDNIMQPIVAHAVPFAVVFGNHDGQDSGVPKETQMAYYQTFPGCLAVDEGDALPGCGTYNLIYKSHDNTRIALNLYFIDSMEYDPRGGYGCVSQEQIAWCSTVSGTLKNVNNGQPVPALAFQHIIVPEVYNAFWQVKKGEAPDAFAGKGFGRGNYYSRSMAEMYANSVFLSGEVREAPCPPNTSNGQFDAWRAAGDVKAAFFGHDHVNTFALNLLGVDLVMTPGATFTSYNEEETRGVRIIEIEEDAIAGGVYETRVLLFRDYYRNGFFAGIWRWMRSPRVWSTCILVVLLLVTAGLAFLILRFVYRRKKRRKAALAAQTECGGGLSPHTAQTDAPNPASSAQAAPGSSTDTPDAPGGS